MNDQYEFIDGIKRELRDCIANGDAEIAHGDADELLCRLLEYLGYEEIVSLYDDVDKWYA